MASPIAVKKQKPMNKKMLDHFEKRLLDERKRVLKELGHYDETFGSTPQGADGDLSAYSFHMADQGTDAMEREKAFLFASQEGRFLWHLDEALRRASNPDEFRLKLQGIQSTSDISREEMESKLGLAGQGESSDPFNEDSPFDFTNNVG